MADDGGVSVAVKGAKSALAHARAAFPQPKAVPNATPRATSTPATPVKAAPTTGDELKAKEDNVAQYLKAVPKMHNGGPVVGDGPRNLKDGEHVLTAAEVKIVRKHALMAAGLKSLAKEAPKAKTGNAKTGGQPDEMDDVLKQPEKKQTSSINIRPEKNQSAKIKVQA
jgi:hypothetical protein